MAAHLLVAFFTVLYTSTVLSELTVTMTTNPAGPNYEVATLVKFQCRSPGQSGSLKYDWYHNCTSASNSSAPINNTGSSYTILSTPEHCLDGVTCCVTNSTNQTGCAYSPIAMLTGVGLTHNHTPLYNNSVLIANSNGSFGSVQCHHAGALNASSNGWTAPSGGYLGGSIGSYLVNRGRNWVSISLKSNASLEPDLEGIYQCFVPNDLGNGQYLFVWIYRYGYSGVPRLSSRSQQTGSHFELSCTFTGAPGILYWFKDSDTFIRENGLFRVTTKLVNKSPPTYTTTLTPNGNLTNQELGAIYYCNILSRQKQEDAQTLTPHFRYFLFVVEELGLPYTLTCIFDLTVTSTWATVDGEELVSATSNSSVTVAFKKIEDTDQGRSYSCHGNSSSGMRYRNFTLAVLVPSSNISVSVSPLVLQASVGEQIELQCLAVKNNRGFTMPLSINWVSSNGSLIEEDDDITITDTEMGNFSVLSVLTIDSVLTSHAGGYTCLVSMETPLLMNPINASEERIVEVQIPAPNVTVSLSLTPSLVYAGGVTKLLCAATLSSIDTPVAITTRWLLPSGSEFHSNQSNMTASSTPSLMVTHLTLDPTSSTEHHGTIRCLVMVHSPEDAILDSEPTVGTLLLEVQEPKVTLIVHPTSVTVPDTPPHNSIQLVCTVLLPMILMADIGFTWTVNGSSLDSKSMTQLLEAGPNNRQSILNTEGLIAGNYDYSCALTLNVTGDLPRTYTRSTQVEVKGPSLPAVPIMLSTGASTPTSVTLFWLVPMVTYTQEEYIVKYGEDPTNLTMNSAAVNGRDIRLLNQNFTLTISGLVPNHTYHYQIVAKNSNGTQVTPVTSFNTAPPSMSVQVLRSGRVGVAGEMFSFTCVVTINTTVTGNLPLVLQWTHSKQGSPTAVLIKEVVNDTTATIAVNLTSVRLSQAGVYSCLTALPDGEEAIAQEELAVQVSAKNISLTTQPSDYSDIYIGHSISLVCKVSTDDVTVDVPLVAHVRWRWNGRAFPHRNNTSLLPVKQVSTGEFKSELVLNEVLVDWEGTYECAFTLEVDVQEEQERLFLPAKIKTTTDLAVNELPHHNISVVTKGTATAGTSYTLTCIVKATDSLLDNPLVEWHSPNGETITTVPQLGSGGSGCDGSASVYLIGPHAESGGIGLSLHFPCLKTSQSGSYTCRAFSSIHHLRLTQETIVMETMIVQIPVPLVTTSFIHPPAHYAGSFLAMGCSVTTSTHVDTPTNITTSWWRNEFAVMNSPRRNSTEVFPGANAVSFHSFLDFFSLSVTLDTGEYKCVATQTGHIRTNSSHMTTTRDHVISASGSATLNLTVKAPKLSVETHFAITSLASKVLDREPYSSFTIDCIGRTEGYNIEWTGVIDWRVASDGNPAMPIPNRIEEGLTRPLGPGVWTSQLKVMARQQGEYVYTCEVKLLIDGDEPVLSFNTTKVEVHGPQSPLAAIDLRASRVEKLNSAQISWRITEVIYLPEEYMVYYGTSREELSSSVAKYTIPDLLVKNNNLSIILDELEVGSTYYYKVTSDNTVNKTESEIKQFIAGFNSSLFQVKLSGVHSCAEWTFKGTDLKKQQLIFDIASAVSSNCNCLFPLTNIRDGHFLCSREPTSVIFRARLYGTLDNPDPQLLIRSLQQWVMGTQTLLLDSVRLEVDPTCNVTIQTLTEAVCTQDSLTSPVSSPDATKEANGLLYGIIGGVIAITLVCVIVALCLVILCCKLSNRKKSKADQPLTLKTLMEYTASNMNLQQLTSPPVGMDQRTFSYNPPLSPGSYKQPHYMSPRASTISKDLYMAPRPYCHRDSRDSHIYYQTPTTSTFNSDPLYEPIPGMDASTERSFTAETSEKSPITSEERPTPPPRSNCRSRGDGKSEEVDCQKEEEEHAHDDEYIPMTSVGHLNIEPTTTTFK